MAITQAQIYSYMDKANVAFEANMMFVVKNKRKGGNVNRLYNPSRWLSAVIDVIESNNGLTNLQIEIIVQKMIEQGKLNDFNGDPIPYTVVL